MPNLGFTPIFGSALQFAFEKATPEGKTTICALIFVSLLSWTVIFSKIGQLARAVRITKKFFAAYSKTHDPIEFARTGQKFPGSPAYEVYRVAIEQTNYHLDKGGILINGERRMSSARFDNVRVAMERCASDQVLVLERGMVVLSTAVAGGPFLGLLGTVWGVMETFAGVARAASASLTAMAPGVAGALIATVVGLFVAIPAMFAHNFMVTRIRGLTQQLDAFAAELAANLELNLVDASLSASAIAQPAAPALSQPATKSSTPNVAPARHPEPMTAHARA